MPTIFQTLMFKLGWVNTKHYEDMCSLYNFYVVKSIVLENGLKKLRDDTPHETIKQEIRDVLREANSE